VIVVTSQVEGVVMVETYPPLQEVTEVAEIPTPLAL
jgi:hypothetical protein